MKCYKHNTNRRPPGRLALFPAPYPGESFYSTLCRYHVRSGNINSWHTSNQLFGYNSSLTSTLLTPFHLEMVTHWVPPSSGIDPEEMLRLNTALNLYGITAISSELDRIQEVVRGQRTTETFPRWMQPRIVNPAGYLRFCPECAAAQIKLYGEPYWQILPQIDEVEYCPLHKVRIRNSQIPLNHIKSHYHPASSVLSSERLNHLPTISNNQEWESLFRREKDFFIKLAQNIDWLLRNGDAHAGYGNLIKTYNRISGKTRNCGWIEVSKRMIKGALDKISHSNNLYLYMKYKNQKQFEGFNANVYSMRICSHVMVMTALYGDPKSFYEQ